MKRYLLPVLVLSLMLGFTACQDDDVIIDPPEPEPEALEFFGFSGRISGDSLNFNNLNPLYVDTMATHLVSSLPPDSSRAVYTSVAYNQQDSVFFGLIKRELAFVGNQPQSEEFFEFFTNDTVNYLRYSRDTTIYDTLNPSIPLIDTIDTVSRGLEIQYLDSTGVLWSSAQGNQIPQASFTWLSQEEIVTIGGVKLFKFSAKMENVTLFDPVNGGILILSEGTFQGFFRHLVP